MTPEKMTNAELADWLSSEIDMMATARNRYNGNLNEAAKRLRAMPEPPEPEFCVGWKGKTRGGMDAEICGEIGGHLVGRIGRPRIHATDVIGHGWSKYGECSGSTECDLMPNTPEPEIWWRPKGKRHLFDTKGKAERAWIPNLIAEKLEVRVIK